jgi:hypothetical protein
MAEHYLTKLIENPQLDDPVSDAPEVHKHFTRYSKGSFEGPVIKISQTKSKISLWCSHEYEDLLMRCALRVLPEDEVSIKGSILGGEDFTPLVDEIGFGDDWTPKKSKGKTKNYSLDFKEPVKVSREKLQKLSIEGMAKVYILLSFTSKDKSVNLKIKKSPPRPSSKNPDETSVSSKLKFASLKLPKDDQELQILLKEIAPDFLDEIPENWKSIIVQNSYYITDLEFPKDKSNSRLYRLNTIRKGSLNRIIDVDKEIFKNEIEFKA